MVPVLPLLLGLEPERVLLQRGPELVLQLVLQLGKEQIVWQTSRLR